MLSVLVSSVLDVLCSYCMPLINCFALQTLDLAAQPSQSADIVLQLRNAGSILLDVSLELQHYADLFTVTPEQCEIEPGGLSELCVSFQAPGNPAASVYNRSVMREYHGSCRLQLLFVTALCVSRIDR